MHRLLIVLSILISFGCVSHRVYRLPTDEYNCLHQGCADRSDTYIYRFDKDEYRRALQTCDVVMGTSGANSENDWSRIERTGTCEWRLPSKYASMPEAGRWRYHLAVIEFDDQGEFWRRAQLDEDAQCLLYRLTAEPLMEPRLEEKCATPLARPSFRGIYDDGASRPAIVVLFVHGWKHDASPRNEDDRRNLYRFHKLLKQAAVKEFQRAERCAEAGGRDKCLLKPREVIGVYLAWRGKNMYKLGGLHQASIFNRRAAADRVARVPLSHTIHRIGSWTRNFNRNSVSVIVGHSLGGQILEGIITRSLTSETKNLAELLPIDLVVLINPANEAILAHQSIDVLGPPAPRAVSKASQLEIPMIVSIASKDDRAVRKWFGISQQIKGYSKKFRHGRHPNLKKSQRFYYTHTPGFSRDPHLVSHHACRTERRKTGEARQAPSLHSIAPIPWVTVDESGPCSMPERHPDEEEPTQAEKLEARRFHDLEQRIDEQLYQAKPQGRCITRIAYVTESVTDDDTQHDKEGDFEWVIERKKDTTNLSPYWVMRAEEEMISNHNDVFNKNVIALIGALINVNRGAINREEHETIQCKDDD